MEALSLEHNHVSDEDLAEVAEVSSILEDTNDYLHPRFRAECERIFPEGKEVLPNEALPFVS